MARLHYACRLTEKALNHQHRVVIAVNNETEACALSEHLWCFKPESFVPHHLQNAPATAPVALIWDQDNESHHDVLINLQTGIPEGFSRFRRLMEIVVQEATCLTQTRSHFQFYRERGYPLKSHNIHG